MQQKRGMGLPTQNEAIGRRENKKEEVRGLAMARKLRLSLQECGEPSLFLLVFRGKIGK